MPKRSAPLTDPPKERPLPTSRSVLTRPASAARAAMEQGGPAFTPALPDPSAKRTRIAYTTVSDRNGRSNAPAVEMSQRANCSRRSIVRSISCLVVRGLSVHSRTTARPSRIVVLGAAYPSAIVARTIASV